MPFSHVIRKKIHLYESYVWVCYTPSQLVKLNQSALITSVRNLLWTVRPIIRFPALYEDPSNLKRF